MAPMAGVTDAAFRSICSTLGADLTCTEMVSAMALMYQDKKTRELLKPFPGEGPFAAQIFGSDAAVMGEAAVKARELSGCQIIDVNMGCPVGKVVNSGDGSALMRDPDKAYQIISAVVRAAGCPVTVKFRKGWDKGSVNAVEFARMCQDAGAAAVTVHGRTRTQMYSGRADWDIIRAVKENVDIPVIANGDVFEGPDAARLLRYTGADMVMIGRGCFGNPWLFQAAKAAIAGQAIPALPPLARRLDTALTQLELAAGQKGEHTACMEARRHLAWYLKGVPHAGYYRQEIVKIDSLDQARRLVSQMKRDLR